MRLLTLLGTSLLLVGSSRATFAQDPQFSQFYANPLYHNPAFAGATGTTRLVANYRNQWPALPGNYQTAAFSIDTYAEDQRVGLGAQLISDHQGGSFRATQLSGMANYTVPLLQEKARLVMGIQAAYIGTQFTPSGMTFADQYGPGGLVSQITNDPLAQGTLTQKSLDFSSGLVFEHELGDDMATYWMGASMHHMGRSQARGDWLGQRLTGMAGIRLPFTSTLGNQGLGHQQNRDQSIGLTGYVRQQGNNVQLDVGLNLIYSPVMLGLWYRGIPLRRTGQTYQNDALIGIFALHVANMMVQYSYDITVSSLRFSTGGAHEISIWYGLDALFSFTGKNFSLKRQRRCYQF
ncbi:hypothetical protein GCM10027578_24470 [Spirosoma luteolum]